MGSRSIGLPLPGRLSNLPSRIASSIRRSASRRIALSMSMFLSGIDRIIARQTAHPSDLNVLPVAPQKVCKDQPAADRQLAAEHDPDRADAHLEIAADDEHAEQTQAERAGERDAHDVKR